KEVTQEQFQSLMGYSPWFHTDCGKKCSVEWVNWHEAASYCNSLSKAEGKAVCYSCTGVKGDVECELTANNIYDCQGYRLPTEAEWEYAARGGTNSAFCNGNIASCMTEDTNAEKIAWYKVNSGGIVHPAGEKQPNAWGLYDMSGNVYEWTNDWYLSDLGTESKTDPVGPGDGTERVFRGGAWYFNAHHARSANRERFQPSKRFTFLGFRCVRSL
ncbi:MAG: formylglycine-generating enzyme family protein, partial [Pseudomonadota bacterium]